MSEQLGEKTRWQASGELAMMFQGTYTSAFYREVRNLLHEEVRISCPHGTRGSRAMDSARRSLQWRWDRLLARQETYLNVSPPAVQTGASPAAGFP